MERLQKFKLSFPLHPFLIATFPILFLYSNNIEEVFLDVLPIPLFYSFLFTIFIFVPLSLLLRNSVKAGVILSIFLILFFSYGRLTPALGAPPQIAILVWAVLFALGAYFSLKAQRNLLVLTQFLNVTSFILVGSLLFNILYFEVSTNRISRLFKSEVGPEITTKLTKPMNPPDIYYLIVDRYSNPETIEEEYDYDISDFTDFLSRKGFYLASRSRANYPRSFLSLGSSLNMEYVNYLTDKHGRDSSDETAAYYLLGNYTVQQLLKSAGYEYIHIGGWWEPTRKNEHADRNFFYSPLKFKYLEDLDEFSTKLLESTALSVFLTQSSPEGTHEPLYSRNNHRESALYQLKKLNQVLGDTTGPKYVFAHFIVPHSPYVLDQNCNPITKQQAESRSNKENYLNQLTCVNKHLKTSIEKILQKSTNTVIVLQSDEGPDPINHQLNKRWQESSIEALKEKTSILNAYYLPGKDKRILYQSVTPVNTFRIIFNLYFGTDFDILEDKIYMIESKKLPYKFFELTDRL